MPPASRIPTLTTVPDLAHSDTAVALLQGVAKKMAPLMRTFGMAVTNLMEYAPYEREEVFRTVYVAGRIDVLVRLRTFAPKSETFLSEGVVIDIMLRALVHKSYVPHLIAYEAYLGALRREFDSHHPSVRMETTQISCCLRGGGTAIDAIVIGTVPFQGRTDNAPH
jgi:hypothetical protein